MGNKCTFKCSPKQNHIRLKSMDLTLPDSLPHSIESNLLPPSMLKLTIPQSQTQLMSQFQDRRLVFVSFNGLLKSWKKVPLLAMYTAILLVPLRRKWILKPRKYWNELQSNLFSKITSFSNEDAKSFIQLLKFKDHQHLVVWTLDYCDVSGKPLDSDSKCASVCMRHMDIKIDPLVAIFWYAFNQILTTLIDPATGTKYNSLHLDEEWWQKKCKHGTKYDVKLSSIVAELYMLPMNYRSMQEIVYQSNPQTLHPIVVYGEKEIPLNKMVKMTTDGLYDVQHDTSTDSKAPYLDVQGTWFISKEYDS